MSNKPKPRLCPFKKIIEKEYSDRTGKTTINERFAPCARGRFMAYKAPLCKLMEGRK